MKEFITIISAFLVVVAFSFYMYVSNQKETIAKIQAKELEEVMKKNNEELKLKIQELENHIRMMDSIYHK